MNIPKLIHYCWFGNEKKPKSFHFCLASWKKHLPDYEIIEWNEKNFFFQNKFLHKSYSDKMWSFVSDYARLKILWEYGGIYLDVDMLIIQSIDVLINENDFIIGAEDDNFINGAIIASIKKHDFIGNCLRFYEDKNAIRFSNYGSISIPNVLTETFRDHFKYLGNFNDILTFNRSIVYPYIFFYYFTYENSVNGLLYSDFITKDTFAMHLWNASWVKKSHELIRSQNQKKNLIYSFPKWIFKIFR